MTRKIRKLILFANNYMNSETRVRSQNHRHVLFDGQDAKSKRNFESLQSNELSNDR